MPKLISPLTDIQLRNAKPAEKSYKLSDGGGLYVDVMPNGSKFWRMKVRQANGKESRLTFGSYPDVTLASARAERSKVKQQQAAGIDPAQSKRIEKLQKKTAAVNTFEVLAREWHANKAETWKPNTAKEALARLENDVFQRIGNRPIAEVDAPLMLDVLRQIEKRGAVDMAARVGAHCSAVFRFAIAKGIVKYNPVPDLRGALKPRAKGHHAAIGTDELPEFLAALRKAEAGMFLPTRIMLRLMLLVFVRTSELIETPWSEIDLEKCEWVIPWQRMKRGKLTVNPDTTNHHVCLSVQACSLLRELHGITGGSTYLFPNQRDHKKPMSNNTILVALSRLGYKGRMTGHGFRALAMSTIKERLGYRHEVVDRQLAHAPRDKIASAYDRAQFLAERKKMMQDWADYLEGLARKMR